MGIYEELSKLNTPSLTSGPPQKKGADKAAASISEDPPAKGKDEACSKEKGKVELTPRNRDTTTPRNHETMVSPYHDAIINIVRKAVKQLGKEAATHRFTDEEKKALADIIYTYRSQGLRTSENEITRIAVNFIIEDYQRNGRGSVLDKTLKKLNE